MKKIDMSIFPKEREEKLKKIYRFSMFETMYYRSNLWDHSHRVLWLLEELIPVAKKYIKFDEEKARVLALVHDDAEMITGDVQAGHKERMSKKELQKIETSEIKALEKLTSTYPKFVHGYSYKKLLESAAKKNTIESQIVSYVDKIDAQCESIHEVLAGNIGLLRSVNFYDNTFALFPYKFPKLSHLLKSKESPITYLRDVVSPEKAVSKRYLHLNKPHTQKTIKIETDFPFYNTWRKIIIRNSGKSGLEYLTKQKEFLKFKSH